MCFFAGDWFKQHNTHTIWSNDKIKYLFGRETNTFNFPNETIISFSWLSKSMGDIDEDDDDKCKSQSLLQKPNIMRFVQWTFCFHYKIQRNGENQHEQHPHIVWYSTGQGETNSLHLANNYACNVTDGAVYQDSDKSKLNCGNKRIDGLAHKMWFKHFDECDSFFLVSFCGWFYA